MFESTLLTSLVAAGAGYLAGSVPFAYILVRRTRGFDVRSKGSGNVGAANVLRTASKKLAAWVMALDLVKGAMTVYACRWIGFDTPAQALAAFAAVVGHIYPVWLDFRGGKGVATAAGGFLVLTPTAALWAMAVFGGLVALTSYVSLGSVAAASVLVALAAAGGAPASVVSSAAASALLITFRHRSNLARLRAGTERRLGANR